jgi:nucleoside-diphosphate kinase
MRTLVLIKPLGLHNFLMEILRGLKSVGTIVERRLVPVSRVLIEEHYAEHRESSFFSRLGDYYDGKTVMAIVLEGPDVIARVRSIVGPSDPRKAAPDQIRALVLEKFKDGKDGWRAIELATSRVDNLIHASDSEEASDREIALWFGK